MINRDNWEMVQDFLTYQAGVQQVSPLTLRAQEDRLRRLLVWADDRPLASAPGIRPAFQVYMEKMEGRGVERLGAAHLSAIFKTVRQFFKWCKLNGAAGFHGISPAWIGTLRASRGRSESAVVHEREVYTVDEIRSIVALEPLSLGERRVQAGVALLFISGMRIGAFLTLPIECVDLVGMRVMQLPEKGVHTKNSKAAVTPLLAIDDLVRVCREWDAWLRGSLPGSAYWYAHLSRLGQFDPAAKSMMLHRESLTRNFRRDLQNLCDRAGVVYKSPHKLRHGFAVFAIKAARNMEDLKAISQALMHSSVGITDGIYGRLADDDVQRVVSGLGKTAAAAPVEGGITEEMLERVMRKVMAGK